MLQYSGANDKEDRSDIWGFCGGNAWLLYVWLAAYDMDSGSDDQKKYLELMQKSLGAAEAEDGISNGEEDDDGGGINLVSPNKLHAIAHKGRDRKFIGSKKQPPPETPLFQEKLVGFLDAVGSSFATKKQATEGEDKVRMHQEQLWMQMMMNPNCPPELQQKYQAYFTQQIDTIASSSQQK